MTIELLAPQRAMELPELAYRLRRLPRNKAWAWTDLAYSIGLAEKHQNPEKGLPNRNQQFALVAELKGGFLP